MSFLIASLYFCLYTHNNNYFNNISFCEFFWIPLSSSFILKRYSTTTRNVHLPSFHPQLISFHAGALDLFLWQRKRDNMTAIRRRKLYNNWWLVRLLCLSSGLDHQKKFTWETLNIYIKKKKIVVIYSNAHDKFLCFLNLTNNLRIKWRKKF